MKKILSMLSVALPLASNAAYAGFTQPAPVDVDLANRFASGDMLTARNAKNELDFIGCGVRYIDAGGVLVAWGFCQAQDSDGDQITCFTDDQTLVDRMLGMSDYSFITFSWDADSVCTRVGYSTQSFYLPKPK